MANSRFDPVPTAVALTNGRRIDTPAFVYEEGAIDRLLDYADLVREGGHCRVLFALKPFSFVEALRLMAPRLDGLAASSLFEAQLAREVLDDGGAVHITTPGLRPDEIDAIASLCDYVAFNSLSQWDMYQERVAPHASCGLRVNPQLSFLDDVRYDPCRPQSKLGVPLEDLAAVVTSDRGRLSGIEGIHVHSNSESTDLSHLEATVRRLEAHLGGLLREIEWINLGGGYLLDEAQSLDPLLDTVRSLGSRYGLEVFIEPGAAFVRSAGYLVSSVLDVLPSEGKRVAVLDTTVNHMPEVFEFGYEPDVAGHRDDLPYEYILAGCTCLAGDLFGEYRFAEPLETGSRVVFYNAGAYTMSKAHMFNGVNLPSVYGLTPAGDLVLKRRFSYSDFAERWGAGISVPG